MADINDKTIEEMMMESVKNATALEKVQALACAEWMQYNYNMNTSCTEAFIAGFEAARKIYEQNEVECV